MENSLASVGKIYQQIQKATTPQESKSLEAVASAAKAWAKEQNDYELLVASMHAWILARRKTTELIQPNITHGGNNQGNKDVTLSDYGFSKMQWSRRVKELETAEDDITAYFDDCIAKQWEPTLFGLKLWRDNGGAHVSYNSGENEWYTPPEFILSAVEVFGGIDCDPASSDKANEIVQARTYYTKDNSGLDKANKWAGNVWMNPPYAGSLIGKFIDRYVYEVLEGNIYGIVLVNNATETDWFGKLVSVSNAVVFTRSRVKFLDPQGNPGAPLQGQALLYAGEQAKKFIKEFSKFGWSAEL